jgi:hypothetical protein
MQNAKLTRRSLLAIGGGVILHRCALLEALAQASSPTAMEEIALPHNTVLVDHRLYGESQFIGEVINRGDAPIDTPIVGMTAYDVEGNIVSSGYASPVIPVIYPGESSVVTGVLDPPVSSLPDVRIEIHACGETTSPTFYTEKQIGLSLFLENVEEDRQSGSYVATGVVRNAGTEPADGVTVYGLFRNEDGRVAGAAETTLDRAVPAGKSMVFRLDVGVMTFRSHDPFELVAGEYTVELRPGIRGVSTSSTADRALVVGRMPGRVGGGKNEERA